MAENTIDAPRQKIQDALGELHQRFKSAYWQATPEGKDRIRELEDVVLEALTQLNRADLQSRTDEFATVAKQVGAAIDQLQQLKADIDKIIKNVSVAAKVTAAIDKAITAGSGFFAKL